MSRSRSLYPFSGIRTIIDEMPLMGPISKLDNKPADRVVQEVMSATGETSKDGAIGPNLPFGFSKLDKLTGGMTKSDLIVIAGQPNVGKTAFCMNIARHISMLNDSYLPVGIFSSGHSEEQLVRKLLSSESEVGQSKLRTGSLSGMNGRGLVGLPVNCAARQSLLMMRSP